MYRLGLRDLGIGQARNFCSLFDSLVALLSYSSILKMEAVYYSETLVNLYQITRHHMVAAVRISNPCYCYHIQFAFLSSHILHSCEFLYQLLREYYVLVNGVKIACMRKLV
jgi:hypothetical protein